MLFGGSKEAEVFQQICKLDFSIKNKKPSYFNIAM